MNRIFLFLAFSIFFVAVFSQERIRLMHYNLLNYDITTGGCNASNNNVNDKNDYLRTILEYVNPHILTVNEINCSVQTYDKLLNGCLEEYLPGMFERVDKTCPSNIDLSNMIYFRKDILGFHSQEVISTNVRDINVIKLFYKGANLGQDPDTIFLNCIIAHLKAGSGWDDEIERTDETNRLMNFLDQNPETENFVLMGDLNIYRASEDAFQNLVNYPNPDIRFYDPINMIGEWHNNSSYSKIHTQSTHTVQNCFIAGGMDDRFDFILISDDILYAEKKISFDPDSYLALGQDGNHFNKNLIETPVNNSIPSEILNALYNMSDHLPVVMDLYAGDNASVYDHKSLAGIIPGNPVKGNLILHFRRPLRGNIYLKLYSISGSTLLTLMVDGNTNRLEIPAGFLAPGIYILEMRDQQGNSTMKKIIKQ